MIASAEVEILLVEDNPNDAELTLHALRKRKLGSRIVHLRDGAAALEWFFGAGTPPGRGPDGYPKVVLLDLKLPKVDGLEVLRALRADPRTKLLPVVMMTSSNEERDVFESYQLGVNSYVVKPLDFESFSAAVTELGDYWLRVNREPLKRKA